MLQLIKDTDFSDNSYVSRSRHLEEKSIYVTSLKATTFKSRVNYWEHLLAFDRLKYRLSDFVNPTMEDVYSMMHIYSLSSYYILDNTYGVVGEFMLTNRTGNAVQIHFSMHPLNTLTYSKRVAIEILDTRFKGITLYGLTPIDNRVARLFNRMVGFEQIGILPNGAKFKGKVQDAIITVRC